MDNEKEIDRVTLALAQPLVLDLIVDIAIHDKDGLQVNLCRNVLSRLRLVSRAWKESVSRVLEDRKEPLYTVTLTKRNSLHAFPRVRERGKELDNFTEFCPTSTETPTFRLVIQPPVFRLENYESIFECFNEFGLHLLELELNIPNNVGSLPALLPNIKLPALRLLKCNLTAIKLEEADRESIVRGPGNNILLLHSLLNGVGDTLKQLIFDGIVFDIGGLHLLSLPQSLTKLDLDAATEEQLEILLRNDLPNLKILGFCGVTEVELPTDLIFQIMDKFRLHLRHLNLRGFHDDEEPIRPTLLQFPVMEELQELEIYSIMWELWEPIRNLSSVFPKLRSLLLYEHSQEMLSKWASLTSSPMESLKDLSLELVDSTSNRLDTISVDVKSMAGVNHAFPNIRRLWLTVSGKKKKGLQHIFQNMRQLKRLSITVSKSECIENSLIWDSLVTGIPVDVISELEPMRQESGDFLHEKYLPSVKMLSELKTLYLGETHSQQEPPLGPLISELTFTNHGLCEMSNLELLKLGGRFKLSREIKNEWNEKTNRTLEYYD